jgi:hypothetical protein
MIFSPVLAPGLQEGSLKWLHRTENLLNVSVTRARNTLIVVGHWDFCSDLPFASKYRRLAEYMDKRPNLVVREMEHLPIFSGEPFDVIGTLLDPTDREYNRTTLEKLIASCTDFVWWTDPYFQDHVFDLFWDVFQRQDLAIQEIRLLTSVQQAEPVDGSKPKFSTDRAKTLQSELRRRGVHFEARLLPKKELPHDRHLYSLDKSIQMPPFGGAYGDHMHVSEYTESKTEPAFFDGYWNQAEEI